MQARHNLAFLGTVGVLSSCCITAFTRTRRSAIVHPASSSRIKPNLIVSDHSGAITKGDNRAKVVEYPLTSCHGLVESRQLYVTSLPPWVTSSNADTSPPPAATNLFQAPCDCGRCPKRMQRQ